MAADTAASAPAGLCATCSHAAIVRSDRGARFIRCRRSDTDPKFARYPMLPVTACSGHEPRNVVDEPSKSE